MALPVPARLCGFCVKTPVKPKLLRPLLAANVLRADEHELAAELHDVRAERFRYVVGEVPHTRSLLQRTVAAASGLAAEAREARDIENRVPLCDASGRDCPG